MSDVSMLEVCNSPTSALEVGSLEELQALTKKNKKAIVVYYHPSIPSCIVMRDFLMIKHSKLKANGSTLNIILCDVSKPEMKGIVDILLKHHKK